MFYKNPQLLPFTGLFCLFLVIPHACPYLFLNATTKGVYAEMVIAEFINFQTNSSFFKIFGTKLFLVTKQEQSRINFWYGVLTCIIANNLIYYCMTYGDSFKALFSNCRSFYGSKPET